MISCWQLK